MDSGGQPLATPALSWREKISYGVADMGFNFYWANIATFLMIFYTDVFGISAAAAGSMLFAIKIINAFTDPVIGAAGGPNQDALRQVPSLSNLDGSAAGGRGRAHLHHARI